MSNVIGRLEFVEQQLRDTSTKVSEMTRQIAGDESKTLHDVVKGQQAQIDKLSAVIEQIVALLSAGKL